MIELPFVTRKKYNELEEKLECLLCHATGGRYSKSGYTLQDMCKMVNEHIDRCIEDAEAEHKWEANLARLRIGLFGEYTVAEECPKTLLKYWQAQLEAGYPNAIDNVRYFEEIVRRSENEKS